MSPTVPDRNVAGRGSTVAASLFDWLFECVEGANKGGEGCGYPNLIVLLVPAGLAFLLAYVRWSRRLGRGEPTESFLTVPVLAVVFGSLTLALLVGLIGPALR
jgi:hypothetical protein